MAEFLIQNYDSWVEGLSIHELARHMTKKEFKIGYNARTKRGDVLEVGPDGKWSDDAHGGGKFVILRVPLLPLTQAKEYAKPITKYLGRVNNQPVYETLHGRKYNFNLARLNIRRNVATANKISDITDCIIRKEPTRRLTIA